ncbi:hypothetical protein IU433_14145 [Nocardia puris]|uniref:hypothetical protein n=1 Tax=Nocardia puris TaxID=208602 RepID=UPI001893ADDE|nr:hypothetical protein [Nocardia puris]MBF6460178.1 hypothetical protein [Nocardia puris]
MSKLEHPRIVDQDAHDERVALDLRIATLTDHLQTTAATTSRVDHHRGLVELRELQKRRRDAFRREVGWR